MFALTADQRRSRSEPDLVPSALASLRSEYADQLLLPPDQNAGDEIQLVAESAETVAGIALMLTRTHEWSVGIGVGTIETPLPEATRMVRGTALIAAREAVERAKRHPTRCALRGPDGDDAVDDAESVLRLIVALRDKRTDQGWAVFDALDEGLNQKQVAERLDISPQAVGHRVTAGAIRVERESHATLVRSLAAADASRSDGGQTR